MILIILWIPFILLFTLWMNLQLHRIQLSHIFEIPSISALRDSRNSSWFVNKIKYSDGINWKIIFKYFYSDQLFPLTLQTKKTTRDHPFNKYTKFSEKVAFSLLISTRTHPYQGVQNIGFLGYFAYVLNDLLESFISWDNSSKYRKTHLADKKVWSYK